MSDTVSVKSTYGTYLKVKATDYEILCPITDFPDLGGEPEMLETTTLSDNMQTYIAGIQSMDGLSFSANYDMTEYQKLKALEGKKESYAVWFGGTESGGTVTPDGSNGKFAFDGELSVYPVGGGVNEVVGMNITIAPSSPIKFSAT